MDERPHIELRDAYAAVAGRRTAFDNMLWQVPIMAFTAQAFLFTIALGSDSSRGARVIRERPRHCDLIRVGAPPASS
jgi:hypothetical protein